MAMRAVTHVARMGVFDDEVHQLVAAVGMCFLPQVVSELPRLCFVDSQQRRFDQQATVHTQRQRNLHGFHGVVAAVGIA